MAVELEFAVEEIVQEQFSTRGRTTASRIRRTVARDYQIPTGSRTQRSSTRLAGDKNEKLPDVFRGKASYLYLDLAHSILTCVSIAPVWHIGFRQCMASGATWGCRRKPSIIRIGIATSVGVLPLRIPLGFSQRCRTQPLNSTRWGKVKRRLGKARQVNAR